MFAAPPPRGVDGPRVVVVDAGKSTVRAAVFAGDRMLARHHTAAGFPHPEEPGARALVLDRLREILQTLGNGPCEVLVLAATGIRTIGAAERRLRTELADQLGCEVVVENDVVAAYLGALGPAPGILVQAGTGSLALGVREGGRPVHLDGWGHLAGDRGSGFALGRAGLRAACAALDGTGPATALTARLTDPDPEQVIRGLYASSAPVRDVAALAPSVLEIAADGDPVALDTVAALADDLVDLVLTAGRRLGDPQLRDLPVVGVGGLFAGPLVAETVAARLRDRCPRAELLGGDGDALAGGRLLVTAREHPITRLLSTTCRDEDA